MFDVDDLLENLLLMNLDSLQCSVRRSESKHVSIQTLLHVNACSHSLALRL